MKDWYHSKTIWLLAAQLLIIWAALVTGESNITATVGITLTTVAGVITRFYTDQPMKKPNGR